VRVAADLAVALGRLDEIEVGQRVRLARARLDAVELQQVLAHQVRRAAARRADAKVGRRLAKVDRQQLRVAVGHVQQADVAERRRVVQRLAAGTGSEGAAGRQRQAGGRCSGHQLDELAAIHAHGKGTPGALTD
jgi:ribosomal protein L18E